MQLPTNFQLSPLLGSPARAKTTFRALKAAWKEESAGKRLGEKAENRERARKRQFSSEKLFFFGTDLHQICYTLRRHPDAPSYQFSAFSPPRFARESRNHFPRAQGSLEGGISGEKTGSKSRESRKSAEKAVFIGKTFLSVNRFAPNLLHV